MIFPYPLSHKFYIKFHIKSHSGISGLFGISGRSGISGISGRSGISVRSGLSSISMNSVSHKFHIKFSYKISYKISYIIFSYRYQP